MSLKYIYNFNSGSLQLSGIICIILAKGIMGNIHVKLF